MIIEIHINILNKTTLILFWLFIGILSNAAIANSTDKEYEQRLRELHHSISQLQRQMAEVEGSRGDLQRLLRKSEEDIGQLTKRIAVLKEALAREKKQLAQLQNEHSQLELSRDDQKKQIANMINRVYKLGRQSHIKLLLNQQEPSHISRLLRYHRYFIEARAEKINHYIKTMAQLKHLEGKILASSKVLEDKHLQFDERQRQLRSRQVDRMEALSKLNADLKNKRLHLSELQLDQERLQQLLDEATASLANIPLPGDAMLFRELRGKLPKPAAGRVLHDYSKYRSSAQLTWNGIFYDGDPGNKVTAVHYGRVIFSDYLKGQGLLLIIDHGDGYMSLYAHNQALYKDVGDWVASQEVIASIGNSGGMERSGLYFEIRHRGRPQDPRQWLSP